jgi:hypothetical protein
LAELAINHIYFISVAPPTKWYIHILYSGISRLTFSNSTIKDAPRSILHYQNPVMLRLVPAFGAFAPLPEPQ